MAIIKDFECKHREDAVDHMIGSRENGRSSAEADPIVAADGLRAINFTSTGHMWR